MMFEVHVKKNMMDRRWMEQPRFFLLHMCELVYLQKKTFLIRYPINVRTRGFQPSWKLCTRIVTQIYQGKLLLILDVHLYCCFVDYELGLNLGILVGQNFHIYNKFIFNFLYCFSLSTIFQEQKTARAHEKYQIWRWNKRVKLFCWIKNVLLMFYWGGGHNGPILGVRWK